MWPVPLAQVLWRPQLIFSSKTWFFGIYLNFQGQKSLKNQYLPHFESKSYQINSIKFCSSRCFQEHQSHFQSLRNFQLWFNLIFSEEIIQFKNFCTTSANAIKPSWCTPPPWELSKEAKNVIWSIPVQWISEVQNKTNYLPS